MSTASSVAISLTPWELFLHADIVVKSIIVLLILASLVSWAVIVDKLLQFRRLARWARGWLAASASRKALHAHAQRADASRDPIARVYGAVQTEWETSHAQGLQHTESGRNGIKERLGRVAQIAGGHEIDQLQRGLLILATIGSVSPFVGLFGTVWGIMNSFQGIAASNDTSLTVVAPGIAEALFATALGLVAAIPALIAYNRASRDLGAYANRLGTLIGWFEVHLSRDLEPVEADLHPTAALPIPPTKDRSVIRDHAVAAHAASHPPSGGAGLFAQGV